MTLVPRPYIQAWRQVNKTPAESCRRLPRTCRAIVSRLHHEHFPLWLPHAVSIVSPTPDPSVYRTVAVLAAESVMYRAAASLPSSCCSYGITCEADTCQRSGISQ